MCVCVWVCECSCDCRCLCLYRSCAKNFSLMNHNTTKPKTELMFMRTCYAHLNKQKEPGRSCAYTSKCDVCKSELTLYWCFLCLQPVMFQKPRFSWCTGRLLLLYGPGGRLYRHEVSQNPTERGNDIGIAHISIKKHLIYFSREAFYSDSSCCGVSIFLTA